MKKIVRLNERDLTRIVKRILSERGMAGLPDLDIDIEDVDNPTPEQVNRKGQTTNNPLPECINVMTNPPSGLIGGDSKLEGPIDKITHNSSVAPPYQGYTVWKDGKRFCLIKRRR